MSFASWAQSEHTGACVIRVGWSCLKLAILLFVPIAVEAAEVKLRITSQLPNSSHIGANLLQFKEEVETGTNKAIAVEIYDNSRLYKDNEVVGAVSTGAIEMGAAPVDQFADKIPAVVIFQQPFLFNFEALVRAATNPDGEMRQLIDKAVLEATGTRVLWWQTFGSTVFFSKGRPVMNPTGIRDHKIRVFGKTMAAFAKNCGGIPKIISPNEQLQALQDGTVDMVMTGVSGIRARQLWKATDTITRTEHATIELMVIINEGAWQRLSENHRRIIIEVARKVELDLRDRMPVIEADAYRFARENGMKIYELTPDQVAEWRACSSPVFEAFMTDTGDMARRLMGAYGKLRTDPCCNSGPMGSFNLR
jgi:C4-dicarboxylate-binding protein DctP